MHEMAISKIYNEFCIVYKISTNLLLCCDFALLLIKGLDITYLYQILQIVEIQKNHLENQFCNWKSISLVTIMDNSSCHSAAMLWVKFVSTKCGVGTVGHLPWAAVDPWQLKHGDEDGDLDCFNLFIHHLHFSRSDCCPHIRTMFTWVRMTW